MRTYLVCTVSLVLVTLILFPAPSRWLARRTRMASHALLIVTPLLATFALAPPSAAFIVDIDALVNTTENPITVLLEAGIYSSTA